MVLSGLVFRGEIPEYLCILLNAFHIRLQILLVGLLLASSNSLCLFCFGSHDCLLHRSKTLKPPIRAAIHFLSLRAGPRFFPGPSVSISFSAVFSCVPSRGAVHSFYVSPSSISPKKCHYPKPCPKTLAFFTNPEHRGRRLVPIRWILSERAVRGRTLFNK